jgi:3-deoxy-D-manno-octulosonate 8-phosphate phosphatase (KDO 8-P phosphatase)
MDATARAARLKLLVFDVDGVLTDGVIVMHADGSESKHFHIRDGAAMVWAQRMGIPVALLSARTSGATTQRAAQLGIRTVVQSAGSKLEAYEQILRERALADEQVAFMGDDLLDLPVMTRVGLSAAPADAAPEVLERADWVSTRPGGHGAVREFIEMVLRAHGRWEDVLREYQQP